MKIYKKTYLFLLFLLFFIPVTSTYAVEVPSNISLDGIFTTDLGVAGNNASTTDGIATITDGSTNKKGALWSTENNLLDFKKDFSLVAYTNQNVANSSKALADGMAFVLKASNDTTNWFTYEGASLGVLGKNERNGALGIPHSLAIEYDLYGNKSSSDGFFDVDIGTAAHIATVLPGAKEGYNEEHISFITKYRKVNHWNVDTTQNISQNKWNKLEINWTVPENGDWQRGTFEYSINGGKKNVINYVDLDTYVFQNGTVSTAYWGFTGSTGPNYTAKQQVVFEQVPGLVNAAVTVKMFNQNKQEITDNAVLNGGDELTVTVTPQWLGGKQNWEELTSKLQLPASLEIVPNTTSIDDKVIEDTVWQANQLYLASGLLPILGSNGNQSTNQTELSFKVKVKNEATSNQVIQSEFTGRNAIKSAQSIVFSTKKQMIAANIISPEDGSVLLDDERESLMLETSWREHNLAQLTHEITLNQGDKKVSLLSETKESTADTGTIELNWLDAFKELAYGDFTLNYQVTNQTDGTASAQVALKKQNRPILKIEPLENKIFTKGEAIPLHFIVQDKDSHAGSLWLGINDETPVKIATYTDLQASEPVALSTTIETKQFSFGTHQLSFYFVDEDENKSANGLLKDVIVQGQLDFFKLPQDFVASDITIGGADKKVDLNEISVVDERVVTNPWKLELSLEQPFTLIKDEKKYLAGDDFFYYKNGTEHKKITQVANEIMRVDDVGNMQPVVLNQEGENGFYFKASNSLLAGHYQAELVWQLSSAP